MEHHIRAGSWLLCPQEDSLPGAFPGRAQSLLVGTSGRVTPESLQSRDSGCQSGGTGDLL